MEIAVDAVAKITAIAVAHLFANRLHSCISHTFKKRAALCSSFFIQFFSGGFLSLLPR